VSDHVLRLIRPVLDRQHHLITAGQAGEVGVHRAQLHRLERHGHLERIARGLYRRRGSEETWHQRLLAALLLAGHPAQASHRAAARLLQRPTFEGAAPEISVPSKRRSDLPGVIVHESRDIAYVPPVLIDGIPCTPPRRLAVDIGAVLGPTEYATVLRDLRRDLGIPWEQLAGALRLHSRKGRDGCGPLRRQLERTYGIEGIPETTLEQTVLDLLIDAWLPLPVCQLVVPLPGGGEYRIDFAYPEIMLAIEIDGPHHRLPENRARDARRDRRLRALGWTVERFDEEAVTYHPAAVLHAIRRLLIERGLDVSPVPPRLPDLRRGPADPRLVP
jgi:hypothetical protein